MALLVAISYSASQDSGIPGFWGPRILGSQDSEIPEFWDPKILGSKAHGPSETHLRRPKMKSRFFKKNFPILSKQLELQRKVKVLKSLLTLFEENLIETGSV